jgi:hypothetical protein
MASKNVLSSILTLAEPITPTPGLFGGILDIFMGIGSMESVSRISDSTFGAAGEAEKLRRDLFEERKRTTDSRAKSRLTLPNVMGEGDQKANILADVLL